MLIRARLLYRLAGRLRCRRIDRGNGERYLERYWLGRLLGFTAYLHRFVDGDGDEWVHDHPWGWSMAIVLCGGYEEERVQGLDPDAGWLSRRRALLPGAINVIRGGDFHRIVEVAPETWTLFFHRRRSKGWGFFQRRSEGVLYHQPYDVARSADWQDTAAPGRLVDRAPFPARWGVGA